MSVGIGTSCKDCLLFSTFFFSGDLFFDFLIMGFFLDLLVYGLDSWRSVLMHNIQNQKNLGSNRTRSLAVSWDITLLPGSW